MRPVLRHNSIRAVQRMPAPLHDGWIGAESGRESTVVFGDRAPTRRHAIREGGGGRRVGARRWPGRHQQAGYGLGEAEVGVLRTVRTYRNLTDLSRSVPSVACWASAQWCVGWKWTEQRCRC